MFFVEIVAIALFVWALLTVRRQGRIRTLEFVMIFFYGIILEELDMRIFKTYHYSPDFFFTIGNVPVCIALLWALILAGSMAISDRIGLPPFIRPFLDAVIAVWIDLSVDAIAIRFDYWTWIIPLDEGWFGVPAGNLYAWMWVAFCYSMLARVVRHLTKRDKKWALLYLVLPIFAYGGLFVAMKSVGLLGLWLGLQTHNERLLLFWAQFVIFVLVLFSAWRYRRAEGARVPPVWLWSRYLIHGYFLAGYFLFALFREVPLLGLIGVAVLLIELSFLRAFRVV